MPIKSKNYAGEAMTLVLEDDGQPVEAGMILTSGRGERYRVTGGRAPHKPGSTGKVWCQGVDQAGDNSTIEFYPGVVKAMWMTDAALAAIQAEIDKANEDDAMPR